MSTRTTTTRSTSKPHTRKSKAQTVAALSECHDNEIICAVSESRGICPTVGLSFVNLTTCEAVLCQFADTQTYARTCHKIKVFDPSVILIANTAVESKLFSILGENTEGEHHQETLHQVPRRYWSEEVGQEYIQQLALPDDAESLRLSSTGKYFAVCSFAAVLSYIDQGMGKMIAPQTLRLKFEPAEGAMMIDTSTMASLELVQNLQSAKSKDCLFGLMNRSLTQMGRRILRNSVLQPSTDRTKILKRYEAVQELSSKEIMFHAVREALEGIIDTDRALAALVVVQNTVDFAFMESSVNNVLMLKNFVESVMPLYQALSGAESEELQDIRRLFSLENYSEVKDLIEYALNDDCHYANQAADLRNQRVWSIKVGVNQFLDVARQTYKEISADIEEMFSKLADRHQLNLQLKYDAARQFYFRAKAEELEERQLPDDFTNIFRVKGWIECQTLELMKMNQRLKDAHAEVISLSDSSVQKFISSVRSKIQPLFRISEGIALLDMLASFSYLVATQNYIQPELHDTAFAIKAGRHPIRESIQTSKFIPNDVYATPQKRVQIITGCNMSGKSTYIRSIALMAIMAQTGCFVPADYAGFPLIHQVFARVSTDDSIDASMSTFASEMRDMAFILRNVEKRGLVIVDELGRGTSTTDGLAIAIAISEALIESRAYVWFVTHFRELPRILAERAGVVSLHLEVDITPDFSKMKMMYTIAAGFEEQKFYGLAIAKLVDLPEQVHDVAAEVSGYLNERNEARKANARTLAIAKRRNLVLTLKEQLMQAYESQADNDTLRPYLRRLQEEFLIRMKAIDVETAAAAQTESSIGNRELEWGDIGGRSNDPIEIGANSTTPSLGTLSDHTVDGRDDQVPELLLRGRLELRRHPSRGELSEDMIENDEEHRPGGCQRT